MKTVPIFFVIITAFTLNVQAAPKKPVPAKPAPVKKEEPKDDTYPLDGEVVKVTATALVLKGDEGTPDRSFVFTENSKIVSKDKNARLSDIKVGNKVGGLVRKVGKSGDVLLKVDVGVKQGNEPEPISDKGKTDVKKPATTAEPKKKPV